MILYIYNAVNASDDSPRQDEQSSAEKSRLRSEKLEQRRGTDQQERSRAGAQKNRSMRSGERVQKGQHKIEKTAQISKMTRSQQHRKGETSGKVRLVSYEPNMRIY